MLKNPCVFCGSHAYGPGCPFSPTKIHLHPSDPKKCIYCGSVSRGSGCPFNPHGRIHIHGVEFNSMTNEVIDKSITLGYLINELSIPINEMKAYKLGLINAQGKKLKSPETEEEKAAYGFLEEYMIGLKQIFGPEIGILNNAMNVKLESSVELSEYSKLCENKSNLIDNFKRIGKELKTIITNAYNSGVSKPLIEKLIIDSIIENENN